MASTPNFTDGDWIIASTANLDGDPNGDILWQNIADQSLVLWSQNGAATTSATELPSLEGFDVVATGDLDGDGIDDILLQDLSVVERKALLSSTGTIGNFNTGNSTWDVRTTVDTNADGNDDVVWFNTVNHSLYVAQKNGLFTTADTTFASGYDNGDLLLAAYDGTAIDSFRALWFDASMGEYNLVNYTGGVGGITNTFSPALGRDYVNSGDFDGNGGLDHLFIDTSGFGAGDIEIIFTNGITEDGRLDYDADLFPGFSFVAGGDFDGDSRFEMMARDNSTGELSIFEVQGSDQFARSLVGGSSNDLIDASGGNDTVYSKGGDDIVLGGDGRDWLFLGEGDDSASGGNDDDTLVGARGNDELLGGSGNDDLYGGEGDDFLNAGNGTDILEGGAGDDYLLGGAFGFDHMRGGDGNDLIRGGSDRSALEGQEGDDTLIGSSSNDVMFGGNGDDFLVGGLSQDTIFGGSGDDVIVGVDRAGTSGTDDTLYGGSGTDYFYLGNDDGNYYTGSGEAYIMDFSTSITSGDWLMLNGTASNYNFVDTGPAIQVQQSSDNNIIAVIETTATASAVSAKALYIG